MLRMTTLGGHQNTKHTFEPLIYIFRIKNRGENFPKGLRKGRMPGRKISLGFVTFP